MTLRRIAAANKMKAKRMTNNAAKKVGLLSSMSLFFPLCSSPEQDRHSEQKVPLKPEGQSHLRSTQMQGTSQVSRGISHLEP